MPTTTKKTPVTKTTWFGGCDFARTSPPRDDLAPTTQKLNVRISFEEALKLNLAISECVRKLNSYNHAYADGKRAALNLMIHLDAGRVTVNEDKV